jgi:hypothetical protein
LLRHELANLRRQWPQRPLPTGWRWRLSRVLRRRGRRFRPETSLRWHRLIIARHWTYLTGASRPPLDAEVRDLCGGSASRRLRRDQLNWRSFQVSVPNGDPETGRENSHWGHVRRRRAGGDRLTPQQSAYGGQIGDRGARGSAPGIGIGSTASSSSSATSAADRCTSSTCLAARVSGLDGGEASLEPTRVAYRPKVQLWLTAARTRPYSPPPAPVDPRSFVLVLVALLFGVPVRPPARSASSGRRGRARHPRTIRAAAARPRHDERPPDRVW